MVENIVQHVRSTIELGAALNVKCNVINRQLDLLEPSLRSLVTCCAVSGAATITVSIH